MNKNHWILSYQSYQPEQQGLRETLCTLGNGYFATRGAFPEEDANEIHYPGTYLAGGYNRLKTEVSGRMIENEDLVNFPNWLSIKFKINNGDWFHLKGVEIQSFSQNVDLEKGFLIRRVRFKDAQGHLSTLSEERFVHMKYFHLAAIKQTLTAENWSGTVEICSALNGKINNCGVPRYRELNSQHLVPLTQGENDQGHLFLKVQTTQSEIRVAQAARHQIKINDIHFSSKPKAMIEPGYAAHQFLITVNQGDRLSLEKVVSLYTSKDSAISEPQYQAERSISYAPDFRELRRSQISMWKILWNQFDIEIETPEKNDESINPLMVLRLHIFHLLQTVSYHTLDIDAGVPARGWHGEAYRGHIFWDELYIFPLLNLRIPKITQRCLNIDTDVSMKQGCLLKQKGFKGLCFHGKVQATDEKKVKKCI